MSNDTQTPTADLHLKFQEATMLCVRLYRASRSGVAWPPPLKAAVANVHRDLASIWGALTHIYADQFPVWKADASRSGYLVMDVAGADVLVPFHLASDFPVEESLRALARLALTLRASPAGVICISGSATFLEALDYVADVDFCEYAPLEGRLISDYSALEKCILERAELLTEDAACTKSKTHNGELVQEPRVTATKLLRAKQDFMVRLSEDVLEATNLILPICRYDESDDALGYSFPLQEAPVGAGEWLPTELLAPLTLGEYVDWLLSQVREKLRDGDYVKAAKRGLSLSRIGGYSDISDELVKVLQEGTALIDAALDARRELRTVVPVLAERDADIARELAGSLEKTIARLEKEQATKKSKLDSAGKNPKNNNKMIEDILQQLLTSADEPVRAG